MASIVVRELSLRTPYIRTRRVLRPSMANRVLRGLGRCRSCGRTMKIGWCAYQQGSASTSLLQLVVYVRLAILSFQSASASSARPRLHSPELATSRSTLMFVNARTLYRLVCIDSDASSFSRRHISNMMSSPAPSNWQTLSSTGKSCKISRWCACSTANVQSLFEGTQLGTSRRAKLPVANVSIKQAPFTGSDRSLLLPSPLRLSFDC